MSSEPVEVVDYDPEWPAEFERLAARIRATLGPLVLAVEHVGSTAVAGLCAKPIVDVDVVVEAEDIEEAVARLEAIGYLPDAHRLTIPDRHAVAWPEGERRHHVYVCPPHSAALARHVQLRDRLRADPDAARAYGNLKRELAARHRGDRVAYGDAKTAFIEALLSEPAPSVR